MTNRYVVSDDDVQFDQTFNIEDKIVVASDERADDGTRSDDGIVGSRKGLVGKEVVGKEPPENRLANRPWLSKIMNSFLMVSFCKLNQSLFL